MNRMLQSYPFSQYVIRWLNGGMMRPWPVFLKKSKGVYSISGIEKNLTTHAATAAIARSQITTAVWLRIELEKQSTERDPFK